MSGAISGTASGSMSGAAIGSISESEWQPVGRLEDIPVRGARKLVHGSRRIALFRTVDDAVFAIEDRCPHQAGPLSEGIVHDNCVTCPLHNWVISLETGTAQGADSGSTSTFAVRVEAGSVEVELPVLPLQSACAS